MNTSLQAVVALVMFNLLSGVLHVSVVSGQTIVTALSQGNAHTHHTPMTSKGAQPLNQADESTQKESTRSQVSTQTDWPSPVEDEHRHFFFLANILEYRPDLGGTGHGNDYRWDVEGWYGGDYHRIWFKSEGQQNTAFKADYDVDSQLLYGRFFQQYYDFQVGGRLETQSFRGRNVTRGLAVIGLQGLVPYHYEIQPALFISQDADVSARLTATKDLSLTQRLILQLRFETNAAIQRVKKFTTGSGLNNLEGGIRLRYEIRREFAPYIGLSLDKSIGDTASLVQDEGGNSSQIRLVVGVRAWF